MAIVAQGADWRAGTATWTSFAGLSDRSNSSSVTPRTRRGAFPRLDSALKPAYPENPSVSGLIPVRAASERPFRRFGEETSQGDATRQAAAPGENPDRGAMDGD